MKTLLVDRKSRLPRLWSNKELRKVASLFKGDVVNVSGWQDSDKEGGHYTDYFSAKSSYTITNHSTRTYGFQGKEGEIPLDLTKELPEKLKQKFDLVFNHTVLEHIFEVHKAFENLCLMSRDTVILVVPFLQAMHAEYGDFWRFTPTCLQRLFKQHGFEVVYSSYNDEPDASVYVFCVATKHPDKWRDSSPSFRLDGNGDVPVYTRTLLQDGFSDRVGTNSILNIGGFAAYQIARLRRKLAQR